jgi:hypothetical protein
MGLKLRFLALLMALWALSLKAWLVALPLLLYCGSWLWRPLLRALRLRRLLALARRGEAWLLLTLLLAFLSLWAQRLRAAGLFLALFSLLVSMRRLRRPEGAPPPSEALSFRAGLLRWAMVAEVKMADLEAVQELAALRCRLVFLFGERRSLLLYISRAAPTRRAAERRLLDELRLLASALRAKRAYLLPLTGSRLLEALPPGLRRDEVELSGPRAASELRYIDALALDMEGGRVRALGAYRAKLGSGRRLLPAPYRRLEGGQPSGPLLEAALRAASPLPIDEETLLLSRWASTGTRPEAQAVRLGPEQARALAWIYGNAPKGQAEARKGA